MAKTPVNGYVVWYHLHLQDGHEYGAKCFHDLQDALDFINKEKIDSNYNYELFEIGKQIPLESRQAVEKKVTEKTRTVYNVKK